MSIAKQCRTRCDDSEAVEKAFDDASKKHGRSFLKFFVPKSAKVSDAKLDKKRVEATRRADGDP